ncbi:unnamed protein product [Phytophthora fragariaefolia]|uniref:Unnamed protein product n=1 Tax=Phytophthora fragariaefolia TaxID=1490495 RepID=A0A9W6XMY1_9STRA|nr:unnamed protein product [Phytophthora fragariaefolia]
MGVLFAALASRPSRSLPALTTAPSSASPTVWATSFRSVGMSDVNVLQKIVGGFGLDIVDLTRARAVDASRVQLGFPCRTKAAGEAHVQACAPSCNHHLFADDRGRTDGRYCGMSPFGVWKTLRRPVTYLSLFHRHHNSGWWCCCWSSSSAELLSGTIFLLQKCKCSSAVVLTVARRRYSASYIPYGRKILASIAQKLCGAVV